jgi:nucleoside 2-deoxyribosyltransferase
MEKKKIYLAGPDVFRENCNEHFVWMKNLCNQYGFIGLSPFDSEDNFNGEPLSKGHSTHIFYGNTSIIHKCDIIIANLIPFRGACVDDGTAWELGCGYAQGKVLYGHTPFCDKLLKDAVETWYENPIYPIIEHFGKNFLNLMLQESIELSGGKIMRTFEKCLQDLRKVYILNQ